MRLIATIRELEKQQLEKEDTEKLNALADENRRLKAQLERITQDCSHYRVLISATRDECIEIFADPQVKIAVIQLPDTRTEDEFNEAVEWALSEVPYEFKGMMDDPAIRPNLYSVHCMDPIHWRWYRERMAAVGAIDQLADKLEELKAQDEAVHTKTSEAEPKAKSASESIPF